MQGEVNVRETQLSSIISFEPNSSINPKRVETYTRDYWRSLNRLRVQKGRCRVMMKMWKLSHTDVCECEERQSMYHLMTCGDAHNFMWTDLAIPTLAGVNCATHAERNLPNSNYRGLDEKEEE